MEKLYKASYYQKIMAKIIVTKGLKAEVDGKERTIIKSQLFYVENINKDFHTKNGFIKAKDLKKKNGSIIKTSKGLEFSIFTSTFIDDYKRLKRGAQIIMNKEIGMILAETGIDKTSTVIEAGTGSGALTCALARHCKKIYSYDIIEEHLELGKENARKLGIKNIIFTNKDVSESKQKNADAIILDVPDAVRLLPMIRKTLKIGRYIVFYSPTVIPMQNFANAINHSEDFILEKNLELIQRNWKVREKSVRPENTLASHTGFLSFARKIR